MKRLTILTMCLATLSVACANQVPESQQRYIKQYEEQANTPKPEEMLINTDPEPSLEEAGFVDLYNGKNLDGWTPLGGHCTFEPKGEAIVGTTVAGSPSTYLSTLKDDYTDFIFTAELKWIVSGNSGIMFRAQQKQNKNGTTVYGPQCEMEDSTYRGWSGGIYGQSAGGWAYPLWLESHKDVRKAIQKEGWNRVTIQAIGTNIKTWINGIPAANWETDEYAKGFFSLQVHSGKAGEIHFRNIKVKELDATPHRKDLFASDDFSSWTNLKGQPVGEGWSIKDGIIHRNGKHPGDIITREQYDNFDLRFDWKISEAGNSGVKYRTKGALGLEYQILDDAKHKDSKNPTHRTGSLYELAAAPDDKPVNPVGEWNHARIVAHGNTIQHWLNGEKVVGIEYGSDDWEQCFKKSKYAKYADFAKGAGPILLQDHNGEVWFKNVQIREL